MSKPYLIVGAGIAGIAIALELEKRGKTIQLIDKGINHSSRIAAGIVNPIVFRRTTLSWRIHDFLPVAKLFYEEIETRLGKKYLHPIPIRRAFAHQQEKDTWLKRQFEEEYRDFLKPLDESDANCQTVNNTFGTGQVLHSFYISTQNFIDDVQGDFMSRKLLQTEQMDYELLDAEKGIYKGISYEKIIFCEGYHALENPWFSYLPLQATKGQILTLHSHELPEDESLNRKCFILPVGNQSFKVGSTYEWDSPNTEITDEAKTELLSHVQNLSPAKVEVTDHQAGVRPTVLDRRPLMGAHPDFPKLAIFNGLGAKGYLLAPQLSREFIDFICEGIDFSAEMDIRRYASMCQ